jgi:subtilisin family serine protease
MFRTLGRRISLLATLAAVLGLVAVAPATAELSVVQGRYVIVLKGAATNAAKHDAALELVRSAGGEVVLDTARQTGVLVATSEEQGFADAVSSSNLVEVVANDLAWKAYPSKLELALQPFSLESHPADGVPGGGPESPHADPLEPLQWDKRQIRAPEAHAIQAGSRLVQVGILDSGIDGRHADFAAEDGSNVDCALGRDFVAIGPGVGTPDPCTDNQYHGTHVAGIVAARANGVGIVGVAPNVTLVPIKVCDTLGYCYASSTAAGITYAGDAKLEVINMSFYVDDNEFLASTEFKCMNDPVQRAFRRANERAVQYARQQGVVPVAALGNSDHDLAHPPEPYENNCEIVPAETQGVIGTMSLGPFSEKANYSNYGVGATDVAAPGGNYYGPSGPTVAASAIVSTVPGGWGYAQGTSMASPQTAGVAALIVSQFGRIGNDGDVEMPPQQVEAHLQSTTVDIGLRGYDECFGHGRIDALRAVQHDTSNLFATTPHCPEYEEQSNQ